MEKKLNIQPCYFRGVKATCGIRRDGVAIECNYIVYSPFSKKPLAWADVEDVVQVVLMPAYWAVMLSGRDTQSMVNVRPYQERYSLLNPTSQHYGQVRITDHMFVKLPFLSNLRDIEPGELLVLPFDGGMPEIICEKFPPIEAISHKEYASLKSTAASTLRSFS